MELDAVILAGPASTARVHGLSLVERATRVAGRAGARRILVLDEDRAPLTGWWRGGRVLVIRATDQLVHTPLVAPLVAAPAPSVAVAAPEAPALDLVAGAYAGAFVVDGAAADAALAALARGEDDHAIAAHLLATGAAAIPHGAVARYPVRDATERRAAARLLESILIKPQDNAITRYLYRPVSLPLTRLLVRTPITPNQISYVVAVMAAIGLWVTAHASMSWAIAGTAIILASSYVDCCDGEIARLKLLSSRYGAWLDTIVDELSSVGYMLAIGWHCHLHFGPHYFDSMLGLGPLGFDPWLVAMCASLATYLAGIYCIYYNIIVVVGSANSQDYASRLEVVPGEQPNTVRLRPVPVPPLQPVRAMPRPIVAILTFLPNIVRRDFICWAALGLAVLHLTQVAFATLVLGGVVTVAIVGIDHARLRLARRAIARRGQVLL